MYILQGVLLFDFTQNQILRKAMKVKCNVCKESPTVVVTKQPSGFNDLIECPSCFKQLAYATEKQYSRKLIWQFLDTGYDTAFGGFPVVVYNS